jgi:hypothetical protein
MRGLSRRRFGPTVLAVLNGAALVAAIGVGLAILLATRHSHDALRGAGAGWLISFGVLSAITHASHGERDTPAGREVAARWLGVKAWLRGTEAFADLPPAAVAVWDRYLSYGAALGTTRVASAVIDLGMGNRKRVWSSHGGTWHRVRVRYPSFWPRYGKTATRLIVRGVLFSLLGSLLLYFWTRTVAAAVKMSSTSLTNVAGTVQDVGLLLGLVLLGYGLYVLVRTTIDLAAPVTVTGQVLWRQVWRQTSGGEHSPPTPWLHYLAVDDGGDDRTTAWGVPSAQINQCTDGDTVTIKARRWSRRVIELHLVERGSAARVQVADQDEQNTEALVAVAMGLRPAGPVVGTGVAPATLVTAEEVGRAIGAPVTAQGGAAAGPVPVGATRFHTPDGQLALVLMVLGGIAGKVAIRSRRGAPLPGIGDEAYTGPGYAIARRGDTVLGFTTPGRPVDPRALHWLLATAVGRLDATVPS